MREESSDHGPVCFDRLQDFEWRWTMFAQEIDGPIEGCFSNFLHVVHFIEKTFLEGPMNSQKLQLFSLTSSRMLELLDFLSRNKVPLVELANYFTKP